MRLLDLKRKRTALYFHYPCFDGLASAAIASDFLETSRGWTQPSYRPVDYRIAKSWLQSRLPALSAVVDFLYHPDADFWADHHQTTFLTKNVERDFQNRQVDHTLFYDPLAGSCAMLLFRNLGPQLSDEARFGELAFWADAIDSARYATVEEAVFGTSAAMQINLTLAPSSRDAGYWKMLIRSLKTMPVSTIGQLPEVKTRVARVRISTEGGLAEIERSIELEDGDVAVATAKQSRSIIINRYSPYLFYPDARYSVVLVELGKESKITAMRNPWREFESLHLGDLFRKYGGGGHQRVASLLVPSSSDARALLRDIVSEIQRSESQLLETPRSSIV